MTKPSLSTLYRQATTRRDSGVSAEDVARLAAGERMGQRHDAALEALAGSAPALAAFRAVQAITPDAIALAAGERSVVAFPTPRPAQRVSLAMVAGVMGLAVVAGLLWRVMPEPSDTPLAIAPHEDMIFGMSYESDGAIAARSDGADPIFVDEFGG